MASENEQQKPMEEVISTLSQMPFEEFKKFTDDLVKLLDRILPKEFASLVRDYSDRWDSRIKCMIWKHRNGKEEHVDPIHVDLIEKVVTGKCFSDLLDQLISGYSTPVLGGYEKHVPPDSIYEALHSACLSLEHISLDYLDIFGISVDLTTSFEERARLRSVGSTIRGVFEDIRELYGEYIKLNYMYHVLSTIYELGNNAGSVEEEKMDYLHSKIDEVWKRLNNFVMKLPGKIDIIIEGMDKFRDPSERISEVDAELRELRYLYTKIGAVYIKKLLKGMPLKDGYEYVKKIIEMLEHRQRTRGE